MKHTVYFIPLFAAVLSMSLFGCKTIEEVEKKPSEEVLSDNTPDKQLEQNNSEEQPENWIDVVPPAPPGCVVCGWVKNEDLEPIENINVTERFLGPRINKINTYTNENGQFMDYAGGVFEYLEMHDLRFTDIDGDEHGCYQTLVVPEINIKMDVWPSGYDTIDIGVFVMSKVDK